MTAICAAVDAVLDGYFFAQAVGDSNEINKNHILKTSDVVELFAGVSRCAALLRSELARVQGLTVEELDEMFIGNLLIKGASA